MSRSEVATQVRAQLDQEEVELSSSQAALLESIKRERDAGVTSSVIPIRTVRYGEEFPPPANVRIVNGFIIEVWEPIPHRYAAGEPIGALPKLDGYEVKQKRLRLEDAACNCKGSLKCDERGVHKACGRRVSARILKGYDKPVSFAQHIKTLSIQVDEDSLYNGFYPQIPGNDIVSFDRKKMYAEQNVRKMTDKQKMAIWQGEDIMYSQTDNPANKKIGVRQPDGAIKPMYKGPGRAMRGGTRIKGGRAEWRRRTKDMVLYDKGVDKDWQMVREHRQAKALAKAKEIERKVEGQLREISTDD